MTNTSLIQQMYDAFARGDVQAILDRTAPDCEWILEGPPAIPYAGRRRGTAEIAGFFQVLADSLTGASLTIDQFAEQGDCVASHGRFSATVKGTGKRLDVPIAHFFDVRAGKVVRFEDFTDTAATLAAHSASASAA